MGPLQRQEKIGARESARNGRYGRKVEAAQASGVARGLTRPEITRIVNRYIGVSGGYLGDFSYGSHYDFYGEYCELDLNPFD